MNTKSFLVFGLFIIFTTIVFAQKYGLEGLNPSLFEKYRVPDLNYYISNLSAGFSWSDQSMEYQISDMGEHKTSNYRADFSPQINYHLESENQQFIFTSLLALSAQDVSSETNSDYAFTKNDRQNYNYIFNAKPSFTKYFTDANLFYNTSLSIDYRASESRERFKDDFSNNRNYNNSVFQNYSVKLGVGYGKLRNVTPLVQAARFKNRMKVMNIEISSLNDDVLIALSKQFAKGDAYNIVYNRPEKYFWEDVQNVLGTGSIALNEINEFGRAYLHEVLNEIRFTRYEGFKISANFMGEYDKIRNYPDQLFYNNLNENSFALLSADMVFSKQLNLESQLYSTLEIKGGPALTQNPAVKQKYGIKWYLQYSYELTDMLIMSAANTLQSETVNVNKEGSSFRNSFIFSLNYFIEDKISLNLDYSWNYLKNKNYYPYVDIKQNNHSLRIGVSYLLSTGFIK